MWFLRWAPYALAHPTNPFFTDHLAAPSGVNLMWNTASSVFVSVLVSPVTLLFGAIVSYNVVLIGAIALSAWCAFFAVRRYTHSFTAPLLGGAVYAFSPYVISQAVLHENFALAFAPPLFLLGIDELLVRRRHTPWVVGALLGALAAVQLLTTEELVLTSAMFGLVLIVVIALHHRDRIREMLLPVRDAATAALVAFVGLAAWPLAVQFVGPQRITGTLQPPGVFVTDLLNPVLPTSFQLIAPSAATDLSSHFSGLTHEADAYLGIGLIVLLAVFVGRHWNDLRVRIAAIVGLVALVLSLGPNLVIAGKNTGWPLPWHALQSLPLFENALPSRLVVFMWLAVAVLIGIAVDSALAWHEWRKTAPRLVAIAVALLAIVPAALPVSNVSVPAFFQHTQQDGVADGSTLLVAPFFTDGAGADPMLWAAVAGDSFRMPEAYAFVPGDAAGHASFGPPANALTSLMQQIQDTGVVIVVRDPLRSVVANVLVADGVQDVVVGPMANRGQMVAFFTDLFGRPPVDIDGVQLWRNVDRQGVAPPPS